MSVAQTLILVVMLALFSSSYASPLSSFSPSVVFNNSQSQAFNTSFEDNKSSTSPPPNSMDTEMFTQFHTLCMAGIVPEVGLVMTRSDSTHNGTYQQWLYCNQGRGEISAGGKGDHDSSAEYSNNIERQAVTSFSDPVHSHHSQHPETITFVEPAPVEQMHRVILNTNRMTAESGGGGGGGRQKPPIVYVMAPKIKNQYTVHWDKYNHHDDNNGTSNPNLHQNHPGSPSPPVEPTVFFLNRDLVENQTKTKQYRKRGTKNNSK